MENYKVIVSDKLSKQSDIRYIVVDQQGNILDDANGYGYKSIQNAHAGYSYKAVQYEDKVKIYKLDKDILEWIDQNKEFSKMMEDLSYCAFEDHVKFTSKDVDKILDKLCIISPYQTYDIYRMWKDGKPRYEKDIKKKSC